MLASLFFKRNAFTVLADAIETFPSSGFRLKSRDAALVLPENWRARFGWEDEKDKSWETEPDSIVITHNGVCVMRMLDLRRRPPYPETWTLSHFPETSFLAKGCSEALSRLARLVEDPAPSFSPTFSRPVWEELY